MQAASKSSRSATAPKTVLQQAKAKVNLTLHILGKRPDNYHELESLVVFADIHDEVAFEPGQEDSLTVDGGFASMLDGENLITKARNALAAHLGMTFTGRFALKKNIPVAAGLGGGSSDAAAAIRALAQSFALPETILHEMIPIAAKVGADVPVCLAQRASWMLGLGERVSLIQRFPALHGVLVNPRVPLPTAAVFKALNAPAYHAAHHEASLPTAWNNVSDLLAFVKAGRNDLEKPAVALVPLISEVLDVLRAQPGCLLSRLSGSGPTCFALFESRADAEHAASAIQNAHNGWWVAPTTFS